MHEVLRSSGQPLDPATRAFMEPRFAHDFSQVRIHTDENAAESAKILNARAFTIGRDVAFGAGQFRPEAPSGKQLLAHELMHVVQQNGTLGNIQRACGVQAIGSPQGCTPSDPLWVPGKFFKFNIGCDDFASGQDQALLQYAAKMAPTDVIEIHGFASVDGSPVFNRSLACARVLKARELLVTMGGIQRTRIVGIFNHGPTPGPADDRRSVVIISSTITVPPTTVPPITVPPITVPPITVPPITVPPITVPPITVPPITVPPITTPPPCAIPDYCPKSFCSPYANQFLAEASRAALKNLILIGIASRHPRTADLWRQHIEGGTNKQDLSSRFGTDFTNSLATVRATDFLIKALKTYLKNNPPQFPPGTNTIEVPLESLIKAEINELGNPASNNAMRFYLPNEVPGNIAGDIGKDQRVCKVGHLPSDQDDDRKASGPVKITRNANGSLTVEPKILFSVLDTIDLCPGNCGGEDEQKATVPISRWEASGISGDIPFEVNFPAPATPPRTFVIPP